MMREGSKPYKSPTSISKRTHKERSKQRNNLNMTCDSMYNAIHDRTWGIRRVGTTTRDNNKRHLNEKEGTLKKTYPQRIQRIQFSSLGNRELALYKGDENRAPCIKLLTEQWRTQKSTVCIRRGQRERASAVTCFVPLDQDQSPNLVSALNEPQQSLHQSP